MPDDKKSDTDEMKTAIPFEQIPTELFKDQTLTETEIVFYILIVELSHKEGYCYMSSSKLGMLRGKGMRTAQRVVDSLKKKGYVKVVHYSDELGAHRNIIPARYVKNTGGYVKFDIGGYDKNDVGVMTKMSSPYDKNDDINILNKHSKRNICANGDLRKCAPSPNHETKKAEDMFKEFLAAYPKKKDKARAKQAFFKIKNLPDVFPSMMQALEKQKASADWQKDNGQFIPYAAKWLNNERWEDELQTQIQPLAQVPVIPTQEDLEEREKAKQAQLEAYRARKGLGVEP